jgi:hypothetical protein
VLKLEKFDSVGRGPSGILVGDENHLRPLEEILEEEESEEIQEDARDEVKIKSRDSQYARRRRAYYVSDDEVTTSMGRPRVSKRVRYLSDDEIRRECGLMSKPFDNVLKNVFWTLKEEKRPMSCRELGSAVKKKPADVASRLIKVFRRLGAERAAKGEPELIGRYQEGNWFLYFLTEEGLKVEVDELYSAYSQHPKDHPETKKVETMLPTKWLREARKEVREMGDEILKQLRDELKAINGKPTIALQKFVRAEIAGAISSASESILNEVAKTLGGGQPGGIVALVESVVQQAVGSVATTEPHQPTLPGLGQPVPGARLDVNIRFGIAR